MATFNAVSFNFSGSQNENSELKLASIFIILEYETFYKYFILRKGYDFSFEDFILKTMRLADLVNGLNLWGNRQYFNSLFIDFSPYFYFETSQSLHYIPFNSYLDPIVLFFNDAHYVAGLPFDPNARIATPLSNPLVNRFWHPSFNPICRLYDD